MIAQNALKDSRRYQVVVYDLRIDGSTDQLRGARDAWGAYGEIEVLGEHHAALIVRPGGALEVAA